ncbi:hypothetical protein LTR17_009674 [Elasticomyces elasticus]|nr:hypothetical protein LTR17_009674 [Elasticomyces elasticus]
MEERSSNKDHDKKNSGKQPFHNGKQPAGDGDEPDPASSGSKKPSSSKATPNASGSVRLLSSGIQPANGSAVLASNGARPVNGSTKRVSGVATHDDPAHDTSSTQHSDQHKDVPTQPPARAPAAICLISKEDMLANDRFENTRRGKQPTKSSQQAKHIAEDPSSKKPKRSQCYRCQRLKLDRIVETSACNLGRPCGSCILARGQKIAEEICVDHAPPFGSSLQQLIERTYSKSTSEPSEAEGRKGSLLEVKNGMRSSRSSSSP